MEVIAHRSVDFRRGDEQWEVQVRIGRPEQEKEDWKCAVLIEGLGPATEHVARGVDSVQALLLAVVMVTVQLESRVRAEGGTIEWLGFPGAGLPSPDSLLIPKDPAAGV
jgi:hypothetical protein